MQKEYPEKSSIPDQGTKPFGRTSPLRLFVIILASIFIAEIIAMVVVYFIPPLPYHLITLIDAGIMLILIFPILYWLSFHPLIQHIERLQQAKAEVALERSRLRSILDTMPDGIYIVNQQYDVEYINPVIEREFGSVDGRKCYSYFHDQNEVCPWCKNAVVFEGKTAHWEWPSSRTGKIYDVFDAPLTNSDGSLSKLKIMHDITERKRAEEQAREMALFPALNPDAVLQVDVHGRIKKSNPAAQEMGLVANTPLFELIPDLRELDLPEFIASGFTQHIHEARLGERVLQWTIRGAPDLGLAFLYSKDITERKRSEETVRLLSSVVEQTADTVVVTDCDGRIEYVNPAFEQLTGYSKEDALGQTPRVLKSGIHDKQFYKDLWDTVLAGQIFHGEIANHKKNGEIFHEVKTITPLRNDQGAITRFVATGKDITERKQAEQKLRRAFDDLEARVQERTEELRIANSELEDEINVRRRTEGALRQSEQRLNRAQEIAHLGSWELDLVNDQLTWSDEVYRIFGLQPQEFGATYAAFLDAVHPDDRAAVHEAYASSIREGRDQYEIEHRVVRRSNDEIRIVHEKCEHFRDAAGQIIRSVGMVHDITDRKKAEEQLQYQAALLSNLSDAIIASDAEYRLTAWNAAAETLYGWKAEEVLGRNGVEIVHTEWTEADPQRMRRIIAETGLWMGEATQQRKDGTRFPVEISSMVLRDASGHLTGYVSVNRDITERKQAEEALRTSEEKFRRAFADAAIAFTMTTPEGRILDANPAYCLLTGYTLQELQETTIPSLIYPDDLAENRKLIEQMLAGGIADFVIENRYLRKDGRTVWVRKSVSLVRSADGSPQWIIALVEDISERKQAEEALRASEEKYRNLFENMTEEVHFWHLERDEAGCIKTWRLVDANPPTLRTWGYPTIDAIRGRTTDEIFGPGATEHYLSIVQKIMTERVSYAYEDYFPNLDKYFRFTSVPFGEYFITTGADITSIKKAEQALRAAHGELEVRVRERTEELAVTNRELSEEIAERKEIERQLRIQTAAMDAAANGIIITDPKGIMLWVNPAITQISGYEERDLIGQSTHIFSSGRHDRDFYEQMWATIRSGKVWHGETTNRRKDGGLYVEEQTITPVQNEDGEISHFIAIKQDVTERNLIYSQLEDSNRDLRVLTASERQQRFLAEGLVESSVALNMSLELHAVLDLIFEQTRRAIPYLMADVILIQDGVANVVQQWGENLPESGSSPESENLRLADFPVWQKISATKSAVMIPDTELDDQWHSYAALSWIRSYIGAPLIYGGQVIGIINLGSDQPNAFQKDMVKTLAAFAAPAAVAIQNARLYEDEQQNRKVAEILSAASVALSQTLDIETVMETILDYMQFIMPLNVAFVILSEGDERYRVRAVRAEGDDQTQLQYGTLRDRMIDILSEPIVGPYFAKYESTYIPDARQVTDWSPPLELTSMNCWLGIPLESMGKVLGMIVIVHTTPNAFTKYQIGLAEGVVKQAVVALQNAWLFEQVRSGRERLQQLSRHLVEVQENERKYIARELHDETSQSLTSLKMGLQVIEQKAAGHVQLLGQVRNLKHLADETLESLHHLAVNLRPASLDHLGLVDALTGLIESTRQRSGLTARFKTMGSIHAEVLTEEIEASIYRIVQESLTNVVRHAHASYVDVILEWHDDKIVIVIEDDGVGLDLQKARETGHLGLVGMQERAEMLGGKLVVDSTPQSGTTLVVEIPYDNTNTHSR